MFRYRRTFREFYYKRDSIPFLGRKIKDAYKGGYLKALSDKTPIFI